MAEYHYKYTGGTPPKGNGPDDEAARVIQEIVEWIVVAVAFTILWPVGLVLLFRKLNGYGLLRSKKKKRTNTTVKHTQNVNYNCNYNYQPVSREKTDKSGASQPTQPTAAPAQAPSAAQQSQPAPSQVKRRQKNVAPGAMNSTFAKPVQNHAGRGFIIGGGIAAGVFGFALVVELAEFISGLLNGYFWSYMLSEGIAPLACCTGVGLVLLWVGLSRKKKAKRYKQYLALLGNRKEINLDALVKATGKKLKTVCEDLQDMLDEGYLPMGYLDLFDGKLVLSQDGIQDEEKEPEKAEAKESALEESRYLIEIKEVNDDIDDTEMSRKIDHIGEITGKILAYQRENPGKAGELRTFLSYYLPTTLKILRSYAQLEEQGIEGENISAAKARIEGMMDKVVDGFEKQLDKLFQNDALDISADVAVLEKMLDKDGLGEGMTLGI